MVSKTLLETIFPRVIVDNFDIVSIQHDPKAEELHIHLDEKKAIPEEFSSRRVVFNGFTSAKTIQDYPYEVMLDISMSVDANGLTQRPMRYSQRLILSLLKGHNSPRSLWLF